MYEHLRQFCKWILASMLALAIGLPVGLPNDCGLCRACTTASSEGHARCPHCGHSMANCGCCHSVQAGSFALGAACCEKPVGYQSQKTTSEKAATGECCRCVCGDTSPADRPLSAPPTISTVDVHCLAPAWLDLGQGLTSQQRLVAEFSPAQLTPDIPHRILHCSWLE